MSGRWTLGPTFVLRHAGFPFDWIESLGVSEALLARVGEVLEAERALCAEAGGDKAGKRVREDVEHGRVPSAPKGAGPAWAERLEAWKAARAALEAGYPAEKERLRLRLHALANDKDVQEAVFLSSPDMFDNVWARYVAQAPGAENA
ncbi:MAG TPA: hypothetical protein VK420_06315, partial [Longimicrobium sp.]|nr:hypothetical protein [Longimicrobium sp.]